MSHEDAVRLARRLMEADTATEAEADELLEALVRSLACPHVSDYIFWDFDPSRRLSELPTGRWLKGRSLSEG